MKRISVQVTGLSVCAPYQGYVVVLKEQDGPKWLPIFIGSAEAHNISLLLQDVKYVRPLTYDLFYNIIEASGSQIECVTITDLRENTFYAEVQLILANGKSRAIDARPSDAIALAVKTKAPIFVNSRVMDEAGLTEEVASNELKGADLSEQIKLLNERLTEAVEQEAYEDAANIRDQIRALELKSKSS